jgi:tetratricopeptide (TPR) repeat protein
MGLGFGTFVVLKLGGPGDRKMRYCSRRVKPSRSGKPPLWSIFIVTGILLFSTNAAGAQTKRDVERELEKTVTVIERAKEAVSESRNLKAENLLAMAVALQGRARENFYGKRYGMALGLTLNARKKAYEAIGFTKKDEENENLVWKAIERTDQIIDRAKEVAGGQDKGRISSLLEMAGKNQQNAKELFREHRLKAALKLTLEAQERVLNLAGRGRRSDRLAQKELEITDRLIEKASVVIQESRIEKAEQLLDQARDSQEKAWDMFNQKRFGKAAKGAQKAQDLTHEALRLVEEEISPQMVESAIDQNERLIEQGVEMMKTSTNQQVRSTFEKGLSHQDQAKEYYDQGKFKAALAEAKVALRLLNKALEMVRQGGI